MASKQLLSFLSDRRVLLRLDDVFVWLDHLRGYLHESEAFLKDRVAEVEQEIAALSPHKSEVNHYFEAQYEDARMALLDFYPNILRKSLFVATYSLAEVELNTTCYRRKEQDGLAKSLEDIRGPDKSIGRARKYLREIAGIRFPDKPEWAEMKNYQKLRNCIVHSQGTLSSCRNANYLRNDYIPRHSYLDIGSGLYGEEVMLLKGFCEEVIQTIDSFFQRLYGYKGL